MFQTKVVEKIKTHFFVIYMFFFENRTVYEITWKNIVHPDRPQMTICRMCTACWIPKATNTRPTYVIFIAFLLQQWLHECASLLCFRYIACLVLVNKIVRVTMFDVGNYWTDLKIRWEPFL
jgi:hypothetical protein